MAYPHRFSAWCNFVNTVIMFTEKTTGNYLVEWLVKDELKSCMATEQSIREDFAKGFFIKYKEAKWKH